jgi:hypothetical protein
MRHAAGNAVCSNSLYFYTAFQQKQAESGILDGVIPILACFTLVLTGKGLKVLSFANETGIISGFPLPTPELTPGWAILQSVQKELTCVITKSYLSSIPIRASRCPR